MDFGNFIFGFLRLIVFMFFYIIVYFGVIMVMFVFFVCLKFVIVLEMIVFFLVSYFLDMFVIGLFFINLFLLNVVSYLLLGCFDLRVFGCRYWRFGWLLMVIVVVWGMVIYGFGFFYFIWILGDKVFMIIMGFFYE